MWEPFFILFSLLATGYFCKYKKWLDQPAMNGIAGVLINVAMPALLLTSLVKQPMRGKEIGEFFLMLALSIAFFMLFAFLALGYCRLFRIEKNYRGMVQLSMFSSNNGFMGYPVTLAFFGQAGMLMMVANNLAMNIVQWTYGVYILRRDNTIQTNKRNWKQVVRQILNVNIVAILIGLVFSLTGAGHLIPDFLDKFLGICASLATPLSMLYIGAMLHGAHFKDLFGNKIIAGPALTRLTVFVLITFVFLWLLPLPPMIKKIELLSVVLPSAAIVPVMTAHYGYGADLATRIVVLSTLCSMFTTPLGIMLATAVF
jgi:predicted permease